MAVLRLANNVAAGAVVNNIVAGSKFEFLARNSVVEVYSTQNGAAYNEVLMDVTFGNVVEGDQVVVPMAAATGVTNRQEHKIISAVAQAGDRLQIRLQNNAAAAAADVSTQIVITAV